MTSVESPTTPVVLATFLGGPANLNRVPFDGTRPAPTVVIAGHDGIYRLDPERPVYRWFIPAPVEPADEAEAIGSQLRPTADRPAHHRPRRR